MKPWQLEVFAVSIRKKEKWNWAKHHLSRLIQKDSQCLDVGSGVGTLSILQEQLGGSWDFTETDAPAAKETEKIVQGPVYVIDIYSEKLIPGSYDIITIFDVIEHVPDPQRFMDRAAQLLRPHGHIILTTPADDGSFYMWRRFADSAFGIDKDAHGHIVEGFSEQQLRELGQAAHLETKACTPFSFFFTEMVELMYNAAYIVKNRVKQSTQGYNLALSPASSGDLTRHKSQLAILKAVYPLLRGISLLDHIFPLRKGYEWGVVYKKQS